MYAKLKKRTNKYTYYQPRNSKGLFTRYTFDACDILQLAPNQNGVDLIKPYNNR